MSLVSLIEEDEWVEIGRTTATPVEDEKRTELVVDDFYLVVGFEINNPAAYVNGVFDLGHDYYGHAFFYAAKNNVVVCSFSFGPGPGDTKVGWMDKGEQPEYAPDGTLTGNTVGDEKYNRAAFLKDGSLNARAGIIDYPISEMCRSFKIPLTRSQAFRLEVLVDEFAERCASGKQKYTVIYNDTCAEEARDLLTEAGIKTPKGAGLIKHHGYLNLAVVYGVNPFAWHKRFSEAGLTEIRMGVKDGPWVPTVGALDPIEEHKKHAPLE